MGFLGQLFSAQNNYNQTAPQTNYGGQLAGSLGQTNQTLGQEGQLAQALQQQMQGGGPNLAATELQNATQNANSQAAGLIGSQRGISPGTAARQILNQQAANTQGMSGQAAQMAQQQQLAAQGQLGQVLGQQGQLANQQVANLGQLQQGQNALNEQAQLANQQAANSFLPGLLGATGQAVSGIGKLATAPAAAMSEGGTVDAMVSPGEMVIPPGGSYDDGGIIPGKAEVAGDSPKNDTVPAQLPVGAKVIPRSKAADPEAAQDFLRSLNESFGLGAKPEGYGKVLAAKQRMQRAQ